MERAISDEEKIRRAIEISQRRNHTGYARETTRVNVNQKKEFKLFKRMILQMVICLLIYLAFYLVSTSNYVFSDQIMKTTNTILNYDINLEKIYKDCEAFITTNWGTNQTSDNETNNETENTVNTVQEEQENLINNETTNNTVTNQVAKADTEENESEAENKSTTEKEEEPKTQMQQDAESVKKLCKFQKPLNGTITSGFGEREVTSKVMSADHKGIDIATKSGTSIKAAIEGTVSVASQNSEYGKFIKIVNGDVMTVYAHCKSLKVKEGDKVKIGKVIATVGSTGNSTGPHLHFEIRLSNRYIDPKLVINF